MEMRVGWVVVWFLASGMAIPACPAGDAGSGGSGSVPLAPGSSAVPRTAPVPDPSSASTTNGTVGSTEVAERCTACHAHTATAAAHVALFPVHGFARSRCARCHGGDPSKADVTAAHPKAGPDEILTSSRAEAACASCHVPGSVQGMDAVVRGAATYLELGCAFCHQTPRSPGALIPLGPPLTTIGHRGSRYLRSVVEDPSSIFKGTIMPSYAVTLSMEPEKAEALIAYLLSLRGAPPPAPRHSVADPCARCHRSTPPASDPFDRHLCALITAQREGFRCAGCHATGLPPGTRECLYVSMRRQDCGVCHAGGLDGR